MQGAGTEATSLRDPVELRMPADPRHVRLARLLASGVAAGAGFDIEEIEDLRIAIDEVCAAVIDVATGPLLLRFDVAPGVVGVEVCAQAAAGAVAADERMALSEQILDVVVDLWERRFHDAEVTYRLHKVHVEPDFDA